MVSDMDRLIAAAEKLADAVEETRLAASHWNERQDLASFKAFGSAIFRQNKALNEYRAAAIRALIAQEEPTTDRGAGE